MIKLTDMSMQIPRLGYGTAYLTHLDSQAATQVLEAAYGAGIRYFDTAYMYGGGAAHTLMRPFVTAHRDQIVLTSKVGILPEGRDPVSKIARKAGAILGEKAVRAVWPKAFPKFNSFAPEQVTQALDATLADLGTDHLDILMLHEMALADDSDALWQTLAVLKAAGKFKQLGLATDIANTKAIFARRHAAIDTIQLPHKALGKTYTGADFAGKTLISYGIFDSTFQRFLGLLGESGKARMLLTDPALDDLPEADAAGILTLQRGLADNGQGIVLFSSLKPERIAAYARVLQQPASPDTLATFTAIVTTDGRMTAA